MKKKERKKHNGICTLHWPPPPIEEEEEEEEEEKREKKREKKKKREGDQKTVSIARARDREIDRERELVRN